MQCQKKQRWWFREITATIYSIQQVLSMYNLQTRTQKRAVEQSFDIHRCCIDTALFKLMLQK